MIKHLPKILIALFILTAGVYSKSSSISRNVLDSANLPIPDVNVKIKGSYIGTATDVDGRYTLINVPPGSYTIEVSSIGYKTVEYTNIKVKENEATELAIKL